MAEFTLPKNSKVTKGKSYKANNGAKNVRRVNVYRWDPEEVNEKGEPKNPRIDTYEVDMDK